MTFKNNLLQRTRNNADCDVRLLTGDYSGICGGRQFAQGLGRGTHYERSFARVTPFGKLYHRD